MRLPGRTAASRAADARGCFATVELADPADAGKIGDLLAAAGAPLTIFTALPAEGESARFVTELAAGGHEISLLGRHDPGGFGSDPKGTLARLRGDRNRLSEICGTAVRGYRGPAAAATADYFRLIKAAGFDYDSSAVAPLPTRGRADGGVPEWDSRVAGLCGFRAFPVFQLSLPGGTAARMLDATLLQSLPLPAILQMMRRGAAAGPLPVLYLGAGALDPQLDPVDLAGQAGTGRLSRWNLGFRDHPNRLEAASAAWKLREILGIFPSRGRLGDAGEDGE